MPRIQLKKISKSRKQPRWLGMGTLRANDFTQPHAEFSNGYLSQQEPLLDGHVHAVQVHPDIWLHAVEGCDLRTLTSTTAAQLGLHIVIVLEGHVDVAFGHVPLQLPPAHETALPASAHGAFIHLREKENFLRHWRMGKFERKLSLHIHPRMLQSLAQTAGYTQVQALMDQHLCVQRWQPSARAVVLAEQIIHWTQQDHGALLLQSRTLELVHEALQHCGMAHTHPPEGKDPQALPLRDHLRMSKLKAMMDSHQDAGVPVPQLAQQVGMSANALQRHFKQIYGASIDVYRRNQRLEHARALLAQTGCSVQEVAHASGYTSAANFSTAFKRRFGISPKLVRAKL